VPLKASFFDCKPTLDRLERRFARNQYERQEYKERMTTAVWWQMRRAPDNLEKLGRALLTEQRIHMILQRDKAGNCKEVSYVSFQNDCVFNGDELGVHCNAEAIQKVMDLSEKLKRELSLRPVEKQGQRRSLRMRM
jgi:hypothetical protein